MRNCLSRLKSELLAIELWDTDYYYFRPNCTVGFYNQDKPSAKAYILAVRSRIPLHEDEE